MPILVVLGNHDFWDINKKPIWETKKYIFKLFDTYDITYLPNNPVEEDIFNIYGFDGWYGSSNPPSNDLNFMCQLTEGINTHDCLKHESEIQIKNLPNKKYIKEHIVVTHFDFTDHPMSADKKWLGGLDVKADILCVGHSHKAKENYRGMMKIINPGSDYDKPKYVVL